MADELCFSTICKFSNNPLIPSVFFYDLSILCSFIVSHPLYFSYFIFFFPYLFKFISFISPLFFTTALLLLLSVVATTFPHPKLGFIQTVLDKLQSKMNNVDEDDEFRDFEDFEIYKIVFYDPPMITVGDGDDTQVSITENAVTLTKAEEERSLEILFEELDRFEDSTAAVEMKENETRTHLEEVVGELQKLEPVMIPIFGEDQKTVENSFSVKSNSWRLDSSSSFGRYGSTEDSTAAIEMKENGRRSHFEEVVGELQKLEPVMESISGKDQKTFQNSFSVKSNSTAAIEMKENETRSRLEEVVGELHKLEPVTVSIPGEDQKTVENSFSMKSNSWRVDSSSSFGSYGSMRKEREWKRTLACKLFEERHNSEGGEEGMDSLWEAYEEDNSSRKSKNRKESMTNQKKMMIKKKSEFKYFDDGDDEEEDDDDEEEFMSNGQLCCLKALKLSTGKMNLGMGKPNLVKISKALKGFGWLHHVGSKHGKKI